MLSTATRIRVQDIISRLRTSNSVSLEERIYLSKLSKVSSLVSFWLNSALPSEAHIIDEELF